MLRENTNRKGKSRRIAEYIYEDAIGRRAVAKVKGVKPKEKRFDFADTIETIRKWQDDTRKQLRQRGRMQHSRNGTLLGDVLSYLDDLPKGKPRNNTHAYLMAWCMELGSRPRVALKTKDLRGVVKGWIERGDAASTIKKRRRALAQLDEALDLDDEDEPRPSRARRLKTPAEPKPTPRGIAMAILDAIVMGMDLTRSPLNQGRGGRMFRNKARARLRLFLWTGIAPATQRRLDPADVRPDEGTITLRPREKGKGAPGVTLRLFPEGIDAAREWLRAHAWGTFTTRALGRAFHAAKRAYVQREAAEGRTVSLPRDLKPYDIRHSFLSWVWWQTKDPFLVQHFAQHADLETTMRYIVGQIDAQAEAAITAYIARRDVPTAPNGVPTRIRTRGDSEGQPATTRRERLLNYLGKR